MKIKIELLKFIADILGCKKIVETKDLFANYNFVVFQ